MGTILYIDDPIWLSFTQYWDIRILVLLSQFLQIVLGFLTPYRKSSSKPFIFGLIKRIYVLSYIVALMAATYISNDMLRRRHGYYPPSVFWASFILLHLAGSGQSLAYRICDYESPYDHALNFILQGIVMFAVILQQWRQVALPAGWMVIEMVAVIACVNKTLILKFGTSDCRAWDSIRRRKLHNSFVKKLDEVDLVSKAFKYYESSKRLFLGLSFTRTEREQSRKDFLELHPKDAVTTAEITLNLAYDAYYTTGTVDRYLSKYSRQWMSAYFMYLFALMGFFATLTIKPSFLSFSSHVEDKYKDQDWTTIRILCFSNVLLHSMAILRLATSDYAIVCWDLKRLAQLLSHMRRWGSSSSRARIFFRRWSETIKTKSLMRQCLWEATNSQRPTYGSHRFTYGSLELTYGSERFPYNSQRYNDDIGKFIFTKLKEKAKSSQSDDNAGDVFELLGDWILRKQGRQISDQGSILDLIPHLPFDIRLLSWHIATEILYSTREHQEGNDDECREMSNLLSTYMMYLTFRCRHIMSRLMGNFLARFPDIITYIRESSFVEAGDRRTPPRERLQRFYKKITEDYNNGKEIKQPVLHVAVKITKELEGKNEDMWKVISDEWVEMLVYAATNSDPKAHIEKLAQGGELITIVWLLCAHLGFGDYFLAEKQEDKDQAKEDEKEEEKEKQEDKDQAKEDEIEEQEDKNQAKEDEKEEEEKKQEEKDQAKEDQKEAEEEKEQEISQV